MNAESLLSSPPHSNKIGDLLSSHVPKLLHNNQLPVKSFSVPSLSEKTFPVSEIGDTSIKKVSEKEEVTLFQPDHREQIKNFLPPGQSLNSGLDSTKLQQSLMDQKMADFNRKTQSSSSWDFVSNITNTSNVGMIFLDGYLIRQMFAFLRGIMDSVPIIFDASGMRIKNSNSEMTIYVDIFIPAENITEYKFREELCNDPVNKRTILSINLQHLTNSIKAITRNQSFKMYYIPKHQNQLLILPLGQGSSLIPINFTPYEGKIFNIHEETANLKMPNYVLTLKAFATACSTISKDLKGNYVVLYTYPEGVRFSPGDETNFISREQTWGDINPQIVNIIEPRMLEDGTLTEQEYELHHVNPVSTFINKATCKALSKIGGLNKPGIIKIYSKCDNITRLDVPIGAIGNCTLHIQSQQ